MCITSQLAFKVSNSIKLMVMATIQTLVSLAIEVFFPSMVIYDNYIKGRITRRGVIYLYPKKCQTDYLFIANKLCIKQNSYKDFFCERDSNQLHIFVESPQLSQSGRLWGPSE